MGNGVVGPEKDKKSPVPGEGLPVIIQSFRV